MYYFSNKLRESTLLKDFKKFIFKGNVVDLAVGIVIGSAFTAVIKSVVADLITPLVAAIYNSSNFETAYFTVHGSKILYGDLINSIISFLIVALVVFFLVVKPINKASDYSKRYKKATDPTDRICPECLSTIPIKATRCKYCTSKVTPQ
jgi:large conductance mechanosensitive channel protein